MMGAFDWLFGKREIPGQAQAAFDHPKIYGEVETGLGVAVASQAAADWRDQVSAAFADADAALDRVLKDSEIMMQGAGGDQARDAATPLSQATRGEIEVAAQAGGAVQQQAQGSADFKNAFPAPYQVPPDNIGWGDYVNPISYGFKSGVRAAHEEKHDYVEELARQQYESYAQNTNERVNGIQQFAPPPTFAGDVTPAATTPINKVDPSTGYTGTDTGTGQSSTYHPSYDSTPATAPGLTTPEQQPAVSPAPLAPAESSSAWATPPAAGPTPLPGSSAPTPTPSVGGGGFLGGAVIPSGSTSRPGVGGRVGGGTGTGTGRDVGIGGGNRVLGPGGSSGVGGATTGGNSSSAGAGAAGRGHCEDEDKEHTNKYAEPTKDAWDELGLPKTAPAVFGDWAAQAQEGKPPRPPEEDGGKR